MQTTAEILDRFSHLLPYVFSLGLAILFFFAFFLLRKPMVRLLFKIFHRCLRRFHSAQEIIDGFEKPLCAFLVCIGVYLGVWELTRGFSALLGLLPLLRTFLRISLIVALTWGLMNAAEPIVAAVKGSHAGLDKALITFVARIVRGLLFVLSVILIISETGYDITGMITSLGLAGLTVSLAAKDSASNFFGGLVIIADKPFTVGDWIQTPEMEGVVTDVTLRTTRIRTFKDAEVVIPNSILANTSIVNWSRMSKRRVHFTLGVTYDTPQEKLHAAVEGIRTLLSRYPDDVEQESVLVTFDAFGDYSLNLEIYYYALRTTWAEYMELKEKVNFDIRQLMDDLQVEIAFPTQVILTGNTEPSKDA